MGNHAKIPFDLQDLWFEKQTQAVGLCIHSKFSVCRKLAHRMTREFIQCWLLQSWLLRPWWHKWSVNVEKDTLLIMYWQGRCCLVVEVMCWDLPLEQLALCWILGKLEIFWLLLLAEIMHRKELLLKSKTLSTFSRFRCEGGRQLCLSGLERPGSWSCNLSFTDIQDRQVMLTTYAWAAIDEDRQSGILTESRMMFAPCSAACLTIISAFSCSENFGSQPHLSRSCSTEASRYLAWEPS